jgi:hypothetical protein
MAFLVAAAGALSKCAFCTPQPLSWQPEHCVPRGRFDRRRICSAKKALDRAVQRHPNRAFAGREVPGNIADGCALDRDYVFLSPHAR